MELEVIEGIELQMIVETLLVVSVTTLHFSVMPWSPGAENLVVDMIFQAKSIQRMYSFGFLCVGELSAVVRLNGVGRIAKKDDSTLHEING